MRKEETIDYKDFLSLMKHERRIKGRKTENLDGFQLINTPKSWKRGKLKASTKLGRNVIIVTGIKARRDVKIKAIRN